MTGPPPPRCWTLHGAAGPLDVVVHAADDADLGQVRAALAAADLPAGSLWSGDEALADGVRLCDPRLRHGAVLGSGAPGPRAGDAGGALELQVCAGPGAGRAWPLVHGRLVVGRGSGGDQPHPGRRLRLPDPEVSRAHVEVLVDRSGVALRDLGSVNGTCWLVGGSASTPVGHQPQPWPLGATVRVGASSLRLAAPGGTSRVTRPAPGGRVLLDPAPPVPAADDPGDVVVPVPDDPPDPPGRAPAWVAIALPAVAGVVLATVLSAPQYLLFALLGPLVALGTWASDRWSGRRGHRRRRADHALALTAVEAEVAHAVGVEVARREAAAPDLAVLAGAARRRAVPLWCGSPPGLPVRLGVGRSPTRVVRGGAPVEVDLAPVVLDLTTSGLHLVGPRAPVLGAARSLLCQLVALHPPGRLALTVVAAPSALPAWGWTRWLPHGSAHPGPPATGEPSPAHVVLVDGGPDRDGEGGRGGGDGTRSAWLHRARTAGAVVVQLGGAAPPGTPELRVVGGTGARGRLSRTGQRPQLLDLDLVDAVTAARLAADLAPLTVPAGPAGIPDQVRWRDLGAARPQEWSRTRTRLTAVLGRGANGPVVLDLCADGPHALVAGTTGSGKSELLRTLVLGLAEAHPPDRCSFLLVDYKGGAAFAAAADLPHTVGVLTDLDGAATARALRSLGAELTRRERVLAEHRARDLAELPDEVLLPRLVIVVDEFATLGDELPGFVPGLVGIAQRGRSLGVHLVLATQRPSGSVSPEIRANCTVRLCLRTVDEAGSRDVLGVPDAARLPVDRPGRALLRVGADAPVALQVARVGTPAAVGAGGGALDGVPGGVTVHRWAWPDPPAAPPVRADDGPTELSVAVTRLRSLAATVPVPPRPWLAPLPDRVHPAPAATGVPPTLLTWGLVDRPAAQRQEPLLVDLAAGGGWLVLGGPGSGRTTALSALLAAAVARLTPDQVHVHVVDHAGGGLGRCAAALPHSGTVVPRGDGHRLHRLVVRLQEEVDRRRRVPGPHPALLLLVDGLDAVAEALEELLPGAGTGALLRVLREGAAVGLTAVLTADRVLPGSRLAGAAAHRLVLPLTDRADYPMAGVPAALVPGHRPPGRGLLGPDALEVQLALPADLPPPGRAVVPGRVEVVELPADPPDPPDPSGPPGAAGRGVVVGPGGDDGAPVAVDLVRCGGLLVAGPPGSGRSATLAALAGRLARAGTAVLEVGPATPLGVLRSWVEPVGPGRGPRVVLADDLGRLPDAVLDALASCAGPGRDAVLVAAATPSDVAAAFRGPGPALRRTRSALLLRPGRGDAELLGLRLPRDRLPDRPGSGWLVTPEVTTRVQVAR